MNRKQFLVDALSLVVLWSTNYVNKVANVVLLGFIMFAPCVWSQGFLQMPDIIEVPDLERETMVKDLDIPSVRDRDPDPEGGPRLNVTEFRVQGIVEFPKLGITREEIIQRVEAIRFQMMKEGKRTESGFTLDELAEVNQLMIDVEKSTQDRHVGPLEVQKFVFLVREQLRKRGITLGMIETVADTITNYYRERGFILAKAYIPKQKVRDGIVNLTVLLGEFSAVSVEDQKRVSPKLIARAFNNGIHKPVTNWNVEESLYLVNDIPGLAAQGYFSPGEQVGDTKMTVKISDEDWYSANLRLDNHGSESTAENRIYGDIYVHNPLGWGDELHLGVLKSFTVGSEERADTADDDNRDGGSTYGSIRYNSFVVSPRWRASVGYSTNDFVSRNLRQATAFPIEGESKVADASLTYHIRRSRVKNHALTLKYMDIDTLINSLNSPSFEIVKKTSLSYSFDILNEKRRELYIGSVGLHYAEVDATDGIDSIDPTNAYISADMTTLSFFTVPFTDYSTRILTKSALQYSGKSMSNLNQITLTGPSRARGFGVNGFQADDGIYLGVDWLFTLPKLNGARIFGQPINTAFQPFLFADLAGGILYLTGIGDEIDDIEGRLANIGVGIKFDFGKLNSSFSVSEIVLDKVTGLQVDTPDKKVLFELQYKF